MWIPTFFVVWLAKNRNYQTWGIIGIKHKIMVSLKSWYIDLMASPIKWRYYNDISACFDTIFVCNGGEQFIKEMLTKGEKANIGIFADCIGNLSAMRKQHTVSCYFLGILIYNENEWIRKMIDKQIQSLNSYVTGEKPNEKFYYIWMLICLFHDLGYAKEEYSSNSKDNKAILKRIPTKPRNLLPTIYNKSLLRKYWAYRKCRWRVEDHGIIGGLAFYHDMCELRMKMDQNLYKIHCWDKKLEKDYACAAWIIACHNIFTIRKGSEYECCYRHYGLHELITKEYLIKAEIHPILFLFCLVDSIEPIKICGDYSYFDKMDLYINSQDQIELELDRLPITIRKKIEKMGRGLKEWLTQSEEKENKLIINLKPQKS
jgi:hypothetical protein